MEHLRLNDDGNLYILQMTEFMFICEMTRGDSDSPDTA